MAAAYIYFLPISPYIVSSALPPCFLCNHSPLVTSMVITVLGSLSSGLSLLTGNKSLFPLQVTAFWWPVWAFQMDNTDHVIDLLKILQWLPMLRIKFTFLFSACYMGVIIWPLTNSINVYLQFLIHNCTVHLHLKLFNILILKSFGTLFISHETIKDSKTIFQPKQLVSCASTIYWIIHYFPYWSEIHI